MKTPQEFMLENEVTVKILDLLRPAVNGDLDVPNGDLEGMAQAKAMDIIQLVKESI